MDHFNAESLYREIIMEHSAHPHNATIDSKLPTYNIKNPTCGDDILLQVEWKDGKIVAIHHKSIGCAISTSSASIMSDLLVGKTKKQAVEVIDAFVHLVKGEPYNVKLDMQDAIVFGGVANYPARFKCATIAWELAKNVVLQHQDQ